MVQVHAALSDHVPDVHDPPDDPDHKKDKAVKQGRTTGHDRRKLLRWWVYIDDGQRIVSWAALQRKHARRRSVAEPALFIALFDEDGPWGQDRRWQYS